MEHYMSFLNSIINFGKEIGHGIEQVEHKVADAVTAVEHTIAQIPTSAGRQISASFNDLGASLIRHNLQTSLGGVAHIAATATPSSSGSFFGQLGSFFSKAAGNIVSTLVGGLASALPQSLVQAGLGIASK